MLKDIHGNPVAFNSEISVWNYRRVYYSVWLIATVTGNSIPARYQDCRRSSIDLNFLRTLEKG